MQMESLVSHNDHLDDTLSVRSILQISVKSIQEERSSNLLLVALQLKFKKTRQAKDTKKSSWKKESKLSYVKSQTSISRLFSNQILCSVHSKYGTKAKLALMP